MVNLNKNIGEIPLPSSFNNKLIEYRKSGLIKYNESGLPGKKVERWMKFDITPLKSINYKEGENAESNDVPSINDDFSSFCEKIDVINGFVKIDSKRKKEISSFYDVLTIADKDEQKEIASEIGKIGDPRGEYFYNLNSSLFQDPLLIRANGNEKKPPLYLSQIISSQNDSTICNSRIIVIVEENSTLELIQSFSGESSSPYLNNSVVEILLKKGAKLNHIILQEDSDKAYVFNNLFVNQREKSEYTSLTLNAGASISRNEYDISLTEKDSQCTVSGLFLGKEEQLHNSDVTIRHQSTGTSSKSITKAIAGGKSQGVFRGFAFVEKDAQKTDAIQQFKTMLLNDSAQVNMEPHLEIWADDVKCAHGATVGQLDKEQLFYMQTRGYTPEEAKKILMEAFAADVTEFINIENVTDVIKNRIYKLMDDIYE